MPGSAPGDSAPASDEYDELTATVRELVNVMRDGGIERLDLRRGDLRISLRARQQHRSVDGAINPAGVASTDAAPVETDHGAIFITSPMIGTFYSAPAPGERPFVEVGDAIEVGQTVAIIEAMKIMNEIIAERPGVVEEILVQNGEAVEYGHRLIRLRPRD